MGDYPTATVELLGEYQGSGATEAPWLVRRHDGKTVSVSRVLYSVLRHCDGRTSPEAIARAVSTELGRRLAVEDVFRLLDHKLAPLGLLAGTSIAIRPSVLASPLLSLWFRVPLMPASWVVAISGFLRPLFAPTVVLAALAGLVAVDVWLFAVRGVGETVRVVIETPLVLAIVTPLTLLGACFHELGHATACRRGGARPGVIGVGIYLWWLVMFNDLTDTYRLDRRGRLRADLGGVYFNVVFILAVHVAYLLTGFEALLLVILLAHVDIAVQFWPFVRLDGYYVVSDLAGVPDLFPLIRPVLRGTLRRGGPDPAVAALRPRVRRIVVVWVASTVVVLSAAVVWIAIAGPPLAAEAVRALGRELEQVRATVGTGSPWAIAVSMAEFGLLAAPVVGGILTATLVAYSALFWLRRRRSTPDPVRAAYPDHQDGSGGISWRDWDAVVAWSAAIDPPPTRSRPRSGLVGG